MNAEFILCEKCSEHPPYGHFMGDAECEVHGRFCFSVCPHQLKELCRQCAIEKGICQKCGCDLKTEKILYYCQGCNKDKTIEEMANPNDCILPGLCKECSLKTKE
jgi:hypothetical protein